MNRDRVIGFAFGYVTGAGLLNTVVTMALAAIATLELLLLFRHG